MFEMAIIGPTLADLSAPLLVPKILTDIADSDTVSG
jgi:hypothetical protein